MGKEKDGLFGRMVHFWKEKIRTQGEDGIGFWKEAKDMENHFAEMGAVAVLSQKETKQRFWQEEAERKESEKDAVRIVPETERTVIHRKDPEEYEGIDEKAEHSQRIFAAARFAEKKQGDSDRDVLGSLFLKNVPDEAGERRQIIPVAEEMKQVQEEQFLDEITGKDEAQMFLEEEKTTLSEMNIEYVMKEITKKLWEEREGCGRRLR